jgi:nucleotide-binding universal stress UspA family protein
MPLSDLDQDLPRDLGEGPNVIIPPPEPFPVVRHNTSNASSSSSPYHALETVSGRPEFGRDRCTLRIVQGDPEAALERKGGRQRRYVVASDLSEESGYAVEWAIGTVARDGDEVWVVNVHEDESKVDPKEGHGQHNTQDRAEKIKIQRERQTLVQMLARQVNALLQRTHLHITVICQAVHTKNARHMLLDLIDFLDPTLAIVGSRGLGKLKGTILGSMSHYLVQKSSAPVMIARRRLKRHLKRTDPALLRQSVRVPLAKAAIEKTTGGKEENDVIDAADVDSPFSLSLSFSPH